MFHLISRERHYISLVHHFMSYNFNFSINSNLLNKAQCMLAMIRCFLFAVRLGGIYDKCDVQVNVCKFYIFGHMYSYPVNYA